MLESISGFVRDNAKSLAIGGAVLGATAVGATAVGVARSRRKKASTRRKTTRRKSTSRRKLTARQRMVRRIKKRPGRQSPYTAGARRDRSTRRIRHTKNGQPYVILKSGKARFIKKSSAKASRRRRGGRY